MVLLVGDEFRFIERHEALLVDASLGNPLGGIHKTGDESGGQNEAQKDGQQENFHNVVRETSELWNSRCALIGASLSNVALDRYDVGLMGPFERLKRTAVAQPFN